MKAIQIREFGGPEVLKLEEVPDPRPGPGQVLVRVYAVGVNPVDTYIRKGIYGPKEFPYTPGTDAAGVIESLGDGVKRLKVGDRVYTGGTVSGAYAEKVLCNETQVYPLPAKTSFGQGAAINVPYATAFRALHIRAKAIPGEVVLVHGASGGVGIASVQLARAAGLVVIGTAGTEKGRALVIEQGAHHVLDHHTPGYLEEGATLAGGRGFDIIMEMLANENLDRDLAVLARDGRVVVIGSRGKVEIDPRKAMMRDASILGMTLMNTTDREAIGIHAALGAGLETGALRPVIGREMPLAEASAAHEMIMDKGAYGKIVLIPESHA